MRLTLRNQRSILPAIVSRIGSARALEAPARNGLDMSSEEARSIQERREELSKFANIYEEFVELLCDSAQYGAGPAMETRYQEAREQMSSAYRPIRPFVASFLPPDDRDAFRFETGRPTDAFEKLFSALNLQEFLRHDDGEMIFRIMKTREALQLYGEHLRLLATRVA